MLWGRRVLLGGCSEGVDHSSQRTETCGWKSVWHCCMQTQPNQYNPDNPRRLSCYNVWTGVGPPPRKLKTDVDCRAGCHIKSPKPTWIVGTRPPYIRGIHGHKPTQVAQQCRRGHAGCRAGSWLFSGVPAASQLVATGYLAGYFRGARS